MRQNADCDSETSDRGSETWDVPLQWIQQKIGRVVEMFVILQFVAGAFVFFLGIFLLMWAVVPETSLQAASYMLLAFFIIGRALLGLFGYYTDNFCLLFSYGVLLVVTFVVRTIMTLVKLKVSTNPDANFPIPPLLRAAPGAQSAPIELICSVLEFSQAFCSFYMCFIIVKTETLNKQLDEETKLNNSIIISNRFLQDSQSKELKEGDNKREELDVQEKTNSIANSNSDKSQNSNNKPDLYDLVEASKQKPAPAPLKGILHQPSTSSYQPMTFELCTTQSHQQQIPFPSKHPNGHDNPDHNSKVPFGESQQSQQNGHQCSQYEPSLHHPQQQQQQQQQQQNPHSQVQPQPQLQSTSQSQSDHHHYANILSDSTAIIHSGSQFVEPKVPPPHSSNDLIRGHINHVDEPALESVEQYFEEYDNNNNPAWVATNFQYYRQSAPPASTVGPNYQAYHHLQVNQPYPKSPVQFNTDDYMDLSPVKTLHDSRSRQLPKPQRIPRPMDLVLALSPTPPPELNQLNQSANSPLLYSHQNPILYSNNFNRPNRTRRYPPGPGAHYHNHHQPQPQLYPDYGSTNDYECPANLQFPP